MMNDRDETMNDVEAAPQQQQQQQRPQVGVPGVAAPAAGPPQQPDQVIQQIPPVPPEEDPKFMELRLPELARALDIKDAVQNDDRLHNLTDFEYVQWALTTQNYPLVEIRERIFMMQCFKEEYNLLDTIEDAALILAKFALLQQPGAIMAFDFVKSSTENYVLVNDVAKFFPARIKSADDYRIYLGFNYYMFQAGSPTFTAQRNGLSVVLECMDATIEDNFDHRMQERFMQEFMMYYPKRDKEYYFINAPMVIAFIYGVLKPFIPVQDRTAYRLNEPIPGFIEGQRLDSLYMVPNPIDASVRTVKKMCAALEIRYKHQREFTFANARIILN